MRTKASALGHRIEWRGKYEGHYGGKFMKTLNDPEG